MGQHQQNLDQASEEHNGPCKQMAKIGIWFGKEMYSCNCNCLHEKLNSFYSLVRIDFISHINNICLYFLPALIRLVFSFLGCCVLPHLASLVSWFVFRLLSVKCRLYFMCFCSYVFVFVHVYVNYC